MASIRSDETASPAKYRRLAHEDYTVAIICPLQVEMTAMRCMLDEEHARLSAVTGDHNRYIFGTLFGQNVVIGFLPEGRQGVSSATLVATQLSRTFPAIKLRLLVGIGGGVPRPGADIRLGDVVVSVPVNATGGVVEYDLGKNTPNGFIRKGVLCPPPTDWMGIVTEMRSDYEIHGNQVSRFITEMLQNPRLSKYKRPPQETDILFEAEYIHPENNQLCDSCDLKRRKKRMERQSEEPQIHYGLIASGNQVMKSGLARDIISKDSGGAICFEMEAAGLMSDFRCVVIRGISDYCDSHKNDEWQPYAAAAAAAVAKEFLRYTSDSTSGMVQDSASMSRNEYWTVPRPVNTLFTGRIDLLERIKAALLPTPEIKDDQQKRFVIIGMGGMGKSELCLKAANYMRDHFWGVFWVDVSTEITAAQDFKKIADLTGNSANTSSSGVCLALANADKEWLLILDNADDVNFDYQQFIPSGHKGSVLITTRVPNLDQYSTVGIEKLSGLDLQLATELLSKAAKIEEESWPMYNKQVLAIVELLGSHTLALIQAGAFITMDRQRLETYPKIFNEKRNWLLRNGDSKRREQFCGRYSDVYTTFEASAEWLNDCGTRESNDALEFLGVLSSLHYGYLPIKLFEDAWLGSRHVGGWEEVPEPLSQPKTSFSRSILPNSWFRKNNNRFIDEWMAPSRWHVSQLPSFLSVDDALADPPQERNGSRMVTAISLLQSLSLLTIHWKAGSMDGVSMHPLAHSWARDRLSVEQQHKAWIITGSILVMHYHYYQFAMEKIISPLYTLQPHIEHFLNMPVDIDLVLTPQARGRVLAILDGCGRLLKNFAAMNPLGHLLARMFQSLKISPDVASIKYLRLYSLQAWYLTQVGQAQAALNIEEQTTSILLEILPDPTARRRLQSLHGLAIAYLYSNQAQKAREILEEVTEIRNKSLERDHPERLASFYTLADVYIDQNQCEKAITILEEVTQVQEEFLQRDNPERLFSLYNLARAYLENSQVEKSIEILENVTQILEESLQRDDPRRLASLRVLAKAYYASGLSERAIAVMEEVVEIESSSLPSDHPIRLESIRWLRDFRDKLSRS